MSSPIDQLILWAQTRPNATALLGEGLRESYAELLQGIQARAAWLQDSGVGAGDVVALSFDEDGGTLPAQVATFYAIAWLGAVVLPLYPELKQESRSTYADRLGAQWLISGPTLGTSAVRRVDLSSFDKLRWNGLTVPRRDLPASPFHFEFTSGTTGEPKAIVASHSEFVAIRCNSMALQGWEPDDVAMAPTRWPTKVGIRLLLRTLYVGASFLDLAFPNSRAELLNMVRTHGLTHLTSSPWQVRRLLISAPLPGNALLPLRRMTVVGAPMSPDEILAARSSLIENFHVVYASTELGLMGHLGPADAPDAPFSGMPAMEAQALDEHGQPLRTGQVGRLRFRAPWFVRAYAVGTSGATEGFHDGWFVSSDRGEVDAFGGIRLHGRADDVINVGGAKVRPQELEDVLRTHPDVVDVAVMGVPEDMAGEVPIAFFVTRRPITVQAMLDFLATRIEAAAIPAAYIGIDAIPRSPEGKVLRQPLREIFAAWSQQQAALRAGR